MPPMASAMDLREHWADLDRRLNELRRLAARCDGLLAHFDEFLEHNEFEVGLHVLCDRLVAANGPLPTPEEIQLNTP